jgi:hypothetical protein
MVSFTPGKGYMGVTGRSLISRCYVVNGWKLYQPGPRNYSSAEFLRIAIEETSKDLHRCKRFTPPLKYPGGRKVQAQKMGIRAFLELRTGHGD